MCFTIFHDLQNVKIYSIFKENSSEVNSAIKKSQTFCNCEEGVDDRQSSVAIDHLQVGGHPQNGETSPLWTALVRQPPQCCRGHPKAHCTMTQALKSAKQPIQ